MAHLGHWCSCAHTICGVRMKYDRITQFEYLSLDETQDNLTVSYRDQCDEIDDGAAYLEELIGWWKEKGCGACVSIKVAIKPIEDKKDGSKEPMVVVGH